jgi:hypothetical protein
VPLSWKDAFRMQAASDFEVFEQLHGEDLSHCHSLHYLQMSTEKLAKAVALAGGQPIQMVNRSHRAFTRFLQSTKRNHALQRRLGIKSSALKARIEAFLPTVDLIERLAPALSRDGPNAEYPWESPNGVIHAPVEYDFEVASKIEEFSGRQLLGFIRICILNFEEFF